MSLVVGPFMYEPPIRRHMTVAGGFASATHRSETLSVFSSKSFDGRPDSDTSGAS